MEKLKQRIDKYKIFHIAVVLFAVNIAYILILKNPQNYERIKLYDRVKEQRLELIESQNYAKGLNERLNKLKNTNVSLKKFYEVVLKARNEGMVDLRKELAELLKQINIPRIDINYTNSPIPDYSMHEVQMTLPIEGNYANIRKFINSIETSKNFMVIEGVSLSESKQQLKLDIRIAAFFKDYGTV